MWQRHWCRHPLVGPPRADRSWLSAPARRDIITFIFRAPLLGFTPDSVLSSPHRLFAPLHQPEHQDMDRFWVIAGPFPVGWSLARRACPLFLRSECQIPTLYAKNKRYHRNGSCFWYLLNAPSGANGSCFVACCDSRGFLRVLLSIVMQHNSFENLSMRCAMHGPCLP